MRVSSPPSGITIANAVNGDTFVFNSVTNQWGPVSDLPPLAGATSRFEIESFSAVADGTLVTSWPDVIASLDVSNAGGAERPQPLTAADGVREMVFDGAGNFLRRVGMPAVNTPDLVVFLVASHYFPSASDVPWCLSGAGLGSAAGNARGLIGAASTVMGAQANNLGGATARSVGSTGLDQSTAENTVGWYFRRAYCFKWGNFGPTAVARWGMAAYVGTIAAFTALSAVPVATNFSFTACCLGAENNGGGAPLAHANLGLSYFSYYTGAAAIAASPFLVQMELYRLRALYGAL